MSDTLFDPLTWNHLAPLLDRVLELEGPEREQWLNDLAASSPAIATTLRDLLAERDILNARGFLERSLVTQDFARQDPNGLVGQQIGVYTIERSIGFGGMGTVWLARRSDGRYDAKVAVKLLNAALVGHPAERRFIREGNLLAKLEHPNVARLIDAGVTEQHQPYLILEHIDGAQIDRHCDARKFTIRQRIELFLDVLGAVAHAHSHLIIHRDLKPSNILVTHAGIVKLLDFGVAALLESHNENAADLTREMHLGLTPEYAAPEQLLGEPVTTATDVYALGVVLYVLLTGLHPLIMNKTRPADFMQAVLHRPTPPPSTLAAHSDDARVLRGDIDNIVAKALRKHASERYATAEQFAADLRRYLAGEVVHARERTLGYRLGKFIRRNRGGLAAAALVLFMAIAGFISTALQLNEARTQRAVAVASQRRAEAMKDLLQRVLSDLQSRGEPPTSKALLDQSSALLRARFANQPEFLSEMLVNLADEYGTLMDLTSSTKLVMEAREMATQTGDAGLIAFSNCALALLHNRAARRDLAQADLATGSAAIARAPDARIEFRATCMEADAGLRSALGDRAGAIETARRALTAIEQANATGSTIYNDLISRIAVDLQDAGQLSEALALNHRSIDLHVQNGREGTRRHLIAIQNAAAVHYRMGEIAASSQMQNEAFQHYLKLNSPEDLSVTFILNPAISANRMFRSHPALDMLPAALERAERQGEAASIRAVSTALARTRMIQQRPREEVDAPLRHLEEIRVNGKSIVTPVSRVLIEDVRADLDLRDGNPAGADRRARELLDELARAKFDAQRSMYIAYELAARTALANGDPQRALEQANAALALVEPIARGPDTSADVGDALLLQARAIIALGNSRDALPLLQRAVRCLTNGYGASHPTTAAARKLLATLHSNPENR